MRRSFVAGAAVLALAVSSVSANALDDLRRSEPAVDRALAALPSRGVTGTLNQIAALSAQPGAPERNAIRLVASIRRLESQLRAGLPSLDARDRLVLAQVVQELVIEDLLELQGGSAAVPFPCPAGYEEWGSECHPPVERALDDVAELLEGSIRAGLDELATSATGSVPPTPPAPSGGMDAAAFDQWLESVLEGPGLVTGAEWIDD